MSRERNEFCIELSPARLNSLSYNRGKIAQGCCNPAISETNFFSVFPTLSFIMVHSVSKLTAAFSWELKFCCCSSLISSHHYVTEYFVNQLVQYWPIQDWHLSRYKIPASISHLSPAHTKFTLGRKLVCKFTLVKAKLSTNTNDCHLI